MQVSERDQTTSTALGHLLVTGATGFVGSAVVAQAVRQGYKVTPLTRRDVDQRDPDALARAVDRIRPDVAIDAAGVIPGHGDVFENVTLTKSWLRALTKADHNPRLVLIGSASVFGSGAPQDRATREDDPMEPLSDYGRAKYDALNLAREAAQSGLDVQTGILFNLMGAGQPADLAPQVFVARALGTPGGQTFEVGPVGAVRDFMDVEDAASALIALAEKAPAGGVTNIATGRPTSIGDLLKMLETAVGTGWVSTGNANDPRGDYVCYGDPERLRTLTGWTPRRDLEASLERVIAATRETMNNDMRTA